jgi:hypothetical protein
MTRFFMSEPGVLIAEQRPGRSYFEGAGRADPASQAAPAKLSLADMVTALSTAMATIPASETPRDAFHRLAELRSRAEGISLADAYVKQSESTPKLWADVRNAAPLGR